MATITTVASGDLITNSRADLNTNFANLNSDKIETSYLDTDTALAANSDSKIATQKAVKTYIDTQGGANASETVRGIVEEATDSEVTAGTATGGTGAKLFITPAKLATRLATLSDFGDGSDGDVAIAAGTTTLTRDMFYNNLVVTGTLATSGFRIFVKGTISGAGTISHNGSNASGSTGGVTTGSGIFRTNAGGGGATATNTDGTAGTVGNVGGIGGAGGNSSSSSQWGGTATTVKTTANFASNVVQDIINGVSLSDAGSFSAFKASSGAGGRTSATTPAGGGGASGGVILLCAKTWTGTFTLSVTGGAGNNGVGLNTGGGGGGGGGAVFVLYKTKTWSGSYLLTGGAKGNLAGAGGDGVAGTTGSSYEIQINI